MLRPRGSPCRPPATEASSRWSALLAAELTERGNEVTLFAAPGTRVAARRCCRRSRARTPTRSRCRSTRPITWRRRSRGSSEADQPFDVAPRPLRLHRVRVRGPDRRCRWSTRCTGRSPTTRSAFYARHGHKAQRGRAQPLPGRAGAGPARRGRRDRQPDRRRTTSRSARRRTTTCSGSGGINDGQGPEPRDRGRARGRTCRSCWPARSSPASEEFFATRGRAAHRRRAGPLHRRGGRGEGRPVRGRPRAPDADPLARAVRPRDDRGDGVRHAGDRVPGGLGARDRARRRDRLRRGRRARDGRSGRPARRDRPGALPRERARALRRARRGRGVRARLRARGRMRTRASPIR